MQHLLELAVGLGEEFPHLLALRCGQSPRARQLVDEEAVALVGGNPARARVRLGQIALVFESGHLVADRCRRDTEVGGTGDMGRPDGLGSLDVLAHDGPEDCGLAIVEHQCTSGSR